MLPFLPFHVQEFDLDAVMEGEGVDVSFERDWTDQDFMNIGESQMNTNTGFGDVDMDDDVASVGGSSVMTSATAAKRAEGEAYQRRKAGLASTEYDIALPEGVAVDDEDWDSEDADEEDAPRGKRRAEKQSTEGMQRSVMFTEEERQLNPQLGKSRTKAEKERRRMKRRERKQAGDEMTTTDADMGGGGSGGGGEAYDFNTDFFT